MDNGPEDGSAGPFESDQKARVPEYGHPGLFALNPSIWDKRPVPVMGALLFPRWALADPTPDTLTVGRPKPKIC